MKKSKKISIVILMITIVMSFTNIANAAINPDDYKPKDITKAEMGEGIALGQKIVSIINVVGTIIFVLVLIGLGIKYMAGSIEERAEYKKTMIPILIGAIVLYGVSWILKLIYSVKIV